MNTETKKQVSRWQIDQAPDANNYTTIRPFDGTEFGDTDAQPIATVYDAEHANLIAHVPQLYEALKEAHERLGESVTVGDLMKNPEYILALIASVRSEMKAALKSVEGA